METSPLHYRSTQVKVIFNPISGAAVDSPLQLMEILSSLQALDFIPEVCLVEPELDLQAMVRDALKRKISMFVVCGGDGTIESVARGLVGARATLGIIPTGTRNNVAFSLGIPTDISAATALLRTGRRIKVDLGVADCGDEKRPFLEVCSVGLLSALFPAADDIQHGNLARIADFLATLVTSPPAEMRLLLDNNKEIKTQGHVVLAANMPFVGPHYRIAADNSFKNGLLDVLVFANLTKLDLLGYAAAQVTGGPADPRIQHYRVHSLEILTTPALPIVADGQLLGEGALRISLLRRALAVMAGSPVGVNVLDEASSMAAT